jgi:hypothetical protein
MRAHGVPNFPDPDIKGMPAPAGPRQLGVSPALYQVAEQTCRPFLPAGGSLQQQTQRCVLYGECPQVLVQQLLTVERQWAQCLRSHGVPNWPDPTISAKGGRPVFDLTGAGIDPQSADTSQVLAKEAACRHQVGGSVPNLPST